MDNRLACFCLCCLVAICTLFMMSAMAQEAVEPPVDEDGRITKPFSASLTPLTDGTGLVRLDLSGAKEAKTDVTANLLVHQGEGREPTSRLLRAPLAVRELAPPASNGLPSWYVTVDISPDLARASEVELYIAYIGAPSDTGRCYRIKLGKLLPLDKNG
jgi:hypothetical protein